MLRLNEPTANVPHPEGAEFPPADASTAGGTICHGNSRSGSSTIASLDPASSAATSVEAAALHQLTSAGLKCVLGQSCSTIHDRPIHALMRSHVATAAAKFDVAEDKDACLGSEEELDAEHFTHHLPLKLPDVTWASPTQDDRVTARFRGHHFSCNDRAIVESSPTLNADHDLFSDNEESLAFGGSCPERKMPQASVPVATAWAAISAVSSPGSAFNGGIRRRSSETDDHHLHSDRCCCISLLLPSAENVCAGGIGDDYAAGINPTALEMSPATPFGLSQQNIIRSTAMETVLGKGRFGTVVRMERSFPSSSSGNAAPFMEAARHTSDPSTTSPKAMAPPLQSDPSTTPVAVKTVLIVSDMTARSARREAAFALRAQEAARRNPAVWAHIVRVLDLSHDELESSLSIAMELMSAGSVATHAAFRSPAVQRSTDVIPDPIDEFSEGERRSREQRLVRIARDVLRGLATLESELRVIHRDLKPENILLGADGTAKLADFGVAAVLNESGPFEAEDQEGSILYMSPERLRGEAHSFNSDVWSLGVTLLQLALSGRHPFLRHAGSNNSGGLSQQQQQDDKAPTLDECEMATNALVDTALRQAGLSNEFNDFVKRCLAVRRTRRLGASSLLMHSWLDAHRVEMYDKRM